MVLREDGVLEKSTKGECANYDPDKTKPTGLKAKNVEGLVLYKCFNLNGLEGEAALCIPEWCVNYKGKDRDSSA